VTPQVDKFCVLWLRGVIAAAVGFNLSACAARELDDFSDGTAEGPGEAESGEAESGESGTVPSEPFPCPESPIIIEGPVLADGTCGECDEACWAAADVVAEDSNECDFACWCEAVPVCSATIPDEDGLCLHGFNVYSEFCGEGRPLLVGSEVRVADTVARTDWTCAAPRLDVPDLLRARVREGWLERAAMEHASVAAFARFTLQLLGLGAPAELIDASQQAGRDEARHARLCYAIASQLGGPVVDARARVESGERSRPQPSRGVAPCQRLTAGPRDRARPGPALSSPYRDRPISPSVSSARTMRQNCARSSNRSNATSVSSAKATRNASCAGGSPCACAPET
jgi:hypothetical protein